MGGDASLGYGPLHIAAERGMYKKEGLSGVRSENFAEQKEMKAAVASGALAVAAVPTNAALSMKAAGLPIKIVALLDVANSEFISRVGTSGCGKSPPAVHRRRA